MLLPMNSERPGCRADCETQSGPGQTRTGMASCEHHERRYSLFGSVLYSDWQSKPMVYNVPDTK